MQNIINWRNQLAISPYNIFSNPDRFSTLYQNSINQHFNAFIVLHHIQGKRTPKPTVFFFYLSKKKKTVIFQNQLIYIFKLIGGYSKISYQKQKEYTSCLLIHTYKYYTYIKHFTVLSLIAKFTIFRDHQDSDMGSNIQGAPVHNTHTVDTCELVVTVPSAYALQGFHLSIKT